MSIKHISLAVATVALGAGAFTAVGGSAQAAELSAGIAAPVASTSAAAPNYKPIAADPTDKYGFAKDGLEFGYITKVAVRKGNLRIRVTQAEFYDGKAAKLLNGGITPPDGYKIAEDESLTPFTYTVSAKASLRGVYDLVAKQTDDSHRQKITAKQLVKYFDALPDGTEVPVWLRHSKAASFSGPVTALAEQFIP
jgi:hypothetical protein